MSPAIFLGQQAGSSETIPGVGAWEGEQFPWDRHGVLKEVGPILTQPLPGRGTHTWCVNPPALRRVGNRLCGVVVGSGFTPNIQLLAQSKAAPGHCAVLLCDSWTPRVWVLHRTLHVTHATLCPLTFPSCPCSLWGRDGVRGTGVGGRGGGEVTSSS